MTRYLPDVNVWFALMQVRHQHHAIAQSWMRALAEPDQICFCRPTQQGLFRLTTTTVVMKQYAADPVSNATAWNNCTLWLTDPLIPSGKSLLRSARPRPSSGWTLISQPSPWPGATPWSLRTRPSSSSKAWTLWYWGERSQSSFSTARNASCGISTEPTCFMRFLPAFCFSRSLRLREISPP